MPSEISKTYGRYRDALDESRERYERLKEDRFLNSQKFYELFFHDLIKTYDESNFSNIKMLAEQLFQVDKVRFAAVDGSCYKKQLQDYIVFFGASYPIRGTIDFSSPSIRFKYDHWSPDEDVSMVAYVPIPFVELTKLIDDPFVVSDDQKAIDLSNIHLQLMELAEVYQAYSLVKSSDLRPKILLWDQSMSGAINSNETTHNRINLVGYKYQMRNLTAQDVVIAYSHPYNEKLGIPSKKKYKIRNYILWKLQDELQLDINQLINELNLTKNELLGRTSYLTNYNLPLDDSLLKNNPIVYLTGNSLVYNKDFEGSWDYCIGLFEHICKKLYKDKDPGALIYKSKNSDGNEEERWTSPNDLRFLISIGIRALIEECWKHDILLIGIVKDSSSQYLSRNYLGVMNQIEKYKNLPPVFLPWSDRDFLETLPWIDEKISAPWSTIEFDSVFMTLHLERDTQGKKQIMGVRGNIVAPSERLFMRSLAQFYLNKSKRTLTYGHVIFIDRLLIPKIDCKNNIIPINQNQKVLGTIKPIIFVDKSEKNLIQDLMMYILTILTRNLYPDVIGYPDPLQKADWGAKSLYKKIKPIIDSSNISIRSNPAAKTLRQLRDQIKRI